MEQDVIQNASVEDALRSVQEAGIELPDNVSPEEIAEMLEQGEFTPSARDVVLAAAKGSAAAIEQLANIVGWTIPQVQSLLAALDFDDVKSAVAYFAPKMVDFLLELDTRVGDMQQFTVPLSILNTLFPDFMEYAIPVIIGATTANNLPGLVVDQLKHLFSPGSQGFVEAITDKSGTKWNVFYTGGNYAFAVSRDPLNYLENVHVFKVKTGTGESVADKVFKKIPGIGKVYSAVASSGRRDKLKQFVKQEVQNFTSTPDKFGELQRILADRIREALSNSAVESQQPINPTDAPEPDVEEPKANGDDELLPAGLASLTELLGGASNGADYFERERNFAGRDAATRRRKRT